jgi:hypothetical protein
VRNRTEQGDSILQEVHFPHLEEIDHFGPVTAWAAPCNERNHMEARETRTDDKTNVRKCGTYAWCGRYEKIDSLSVGKTRNNNNGYCTKKNRAQGGQRVPSRSLARVLTRVCRRSGTRRAKMVRDYRVGDNVNRLWRKIPA